MLLTAMIKGLRYMRVNILTIEWIAHKATDSGVWQETAKFVTCNII